MVKNAEKRAILFESDLFNTLTHEVLDINLTITFQLLIYWAELVITMNFRGLKIFPLTYHEIIFFMQKLCSLYIHLWSFSSKIWLEIASHFTCFPNNANSVYITCIFCLEHQFKIQNICISKINYKWLCVLKIVDAVVSHWTSFCSPISSFIHAFRITSESPFKNVNNLAESKEALWFLLLLFLFSSVLPKLSF